MAHLSATAHSLTSGQRELIEDARQEVIGWTRLQGRLEETGSLSRLLRFREEATSSLYIRGVKKMRVTWI